MSAPVTMSSAASNQRSAPAVDPRLNQHSGPASSGHGPKPFVLNTNQGQFVRVDPSFMDTASLMNMLRRGVKNPKPTPSPRKAHKKVISDVQRQPTSVGDTHRKFQNSHWNKG